MPDDTVSRDDGLDLTHEDEEMSMDLTPQFGLLLMNQLGQTGNVAQNNFVTIQKMVDYDYLEGKRMVTLEEAVGVREIASKHVPAGPTSG